MKHDAMKITPIGRISIGVEGTDEYLQIKTQDACIPSVVHEELLKRVYRDTHQEAGGYYCHQVTIMEHPYRENEFIGVIHHRYDV